MYGQITGQLLIALDDGIDVLGIVLHEVACLPFTTLI